MRKIYEILIRGNEEGGFNGGHVVYFDNPLPESFTSIEAVQSLAWLGGLSNTQNLIDEIDSLESTLAKAIQEIEILRSEVCPDIQSITPSLLAAGLIAWGDAAIAAYNLTHLEGSDSVTPLILELHKIAMESRSPTQCDRIKDLFGTICGMSGVFPTADQANAMQSILDDGSPATGPVKPEYLNFHPWM
jgi:hypothetical protein